MKLFYQRLIILLSFCFDILVLESVIKYYFIMNKIPQGGFYLFGGLLQINYFTNTNIAFGLPLPQALIIVLVLLLLIFLSLLWWWHLLLQDLSRLAAVSVIIIGALSNLLDRLFFGQVIDYLNIFIWPVFNLADILIVGGVGLYLILNFKKSN